MCLYKNWLGARMLEIFQIYSNSIFIKTDQKCLLLISYDKIIRSMLNQLSSSILDKFSISFSILKTKAREEKFCSIFFFYFPTQYKTCNHILNCYIWIYICYIYFFEFILLYLFYKYHYRRIFIEYLQRFLFSIDWRNSWKNELK